MTLDRQEVESAGAPRALGPYSQALKVATPAFLFISGQLGIDPATGDLVGGGIGEQTRRALENLVAVTKQAGGESISIVKTTVYLATMADFGTMNEVYSTFFERPYPARACVAVRELPKEALVQIEAVAAIER
jgi:2-iminobutanoate/2-iminopropanoate deaminase